MERRAIKLTREHKWTDSSKLRITGFGGKGLYNAIKEFVSFDMMKAGVPSHPISMSLIHSEFKIIFVSFLMMLWNKYDSDHIVFSYPRGMETDILVRTVPDNIMDDIEATEVVITTEETDFMSVEPLIDSATSKILKEKYQDVSIKQLDGLYRYVLERMRGVLLASSFHREDVDNLPEIVYDELLVIVNDWFTQEDRIK